MRKCLVPCLVLLAACASPNRELESHLAILDSHLDRNTEAVESLSAKLQAAAPAQRTPAVAGVTCRDGKLAEYAEGELKPGEKALGRVEKCPAPKDYAQCLSGHSVSDVAAACTAGKLEALLDKPKEEKKP